MDLEEMVIPPNEELKCYLIDIHHNHSTARHPGRDETLKELRHHYHWPTMVKWVEEYVQGCTTCQESKIQTHKQRPSLYKILVLEQGHPF